MGPRAGLDGRGKSRLIGIRSPDHPARIKSLYEAIRLSYFTKYISQPLASKQNKLRFLKTAPDIPVQQMVKLKRFICNLQESVKYKLQSGFGRRQAL